jgi:hypothetical protein
VAVWRCRCREITLISMHPAYRIPAERERCTRFTAYGSLQISGTER